MYPVSQAKKGSALRVNVNSVLAEASFRFDFFSRSLKEQVSNTFPLTLSRPYQKFAVNQNGRYEIVSAGNVAYAHSAAGVCHGVLIESLSSNYIRNSNVFSGTGGWNSPNSGSPAGVAGGGSILNLTPTTGIAGPVLGLENLSGYQATRFAMTATTGEHYVGKYGTYAQALEQISLAFKQNGDTANYALKILTNGVYLTLDSQGQIVDSQLTYSTIPGGASQNNIWFPKVRTTSDGWTLLSWIFDPTTFAGANDKIPRVQVVKKSGNTWLTSFAGTDQFTFDLFGFSREYAGSQAGLGFERIHSSYIHTASAAGPVARAADTLSWSSVNAALQTVMVEIFGPCYDGSLLSIDDNTAGVFVPKGDNSQVYEADNMIDLRSDHVGGGALAVSSALRCYMRRSVSVTENVNSNIFSSQDPHGLTAGSVVSFRPNTNHTLPAPLVGRTATGEQLYYVLSTNLTSTEFMVSTVANGTPVDLTAAASGGFKVRIANSFYAGVPNGDGAQRFIVSWDASNVVVAGTNGGSITTPHGLGGAPAMTHMRFGSGFRYNRQAEINQPVTRAIGWHRVLTTLEQVALLNMP